MTGAAKKDTASGEPVAWENPLIPNKKLRALYVAMSELRLFDEFALKARRRVRASRGMKTVRGEEGCRVSTTIDLKPGDLTSEGTSSAATEFLRSAKLAEAVHRVYFTGKGKTANEDKNLGHLPAMENATDRLYVALGAALALKAKKGSLVVAYLHCNELTVSVWKPVLRIAAENALPMIFVVLPVATSKRSGELSLAANRCGVPGIPVDAADPVALFRVAQESTLRARAGGGPVLMECIPFQIAGRTAAPADPIATMRQFLLHRKIVDEAWLQAVETRFSARLKAADR